MAKLAGLSAINGPGLVAIGAATLLVGTVAYMAVMRPEDGPAPELTEVTPPVQEVTTKSPEVGDAAATGEPETVAENTTTEAPAEPEQSTVTENVPAEPEAPSLVAPAFDVVRVDGEGFATVSGTAPGGYDVDILIDGAAVIQTKALPDGTFAALFDVPVIALPQVLSLVAIAPDGSRSESEASIIVAPLLTVVAEVAPEQGASPEPKVEPEEQSVVEPTEAPVTDPTPAPEEAPSIDEGSETVPAPAPQDEEPAARDDARPSAQDDETPAVKDDENSSAQENASALEQVEAEADQTDTPIRPEPVQEPVTPEAAETSDPQLQEQPQPQEQPAAPEESADPVEDVEEAEPPRVAIEVPVAPSNPVAAETPKAPSDAATVQPGTAVLSQGPDLANPDAPPAAVSVSEVEDQPVEVARVSGAPALLIADDDGVRVLQPANAEASRAGVTVDAIGYDESGQVTVSGRANPGPPPARVRLYLDNAAVAFVQARANGTYDVNLDTVAAGDYTLRVDELNADGEVTSRYEIPFRREAPQRLADLAAQTSRSETGEVQPVSAITVQPGNTLWAIASDRYGEGFSYVRIFEANRDKIRDPDLIYPGQVFDLPD
ncbi:MAG: LysM peptidoglycan-binding domain-containing protein [Oceanicola sp.]|nr:LysM peptidoglycan-binding domain-containing protein [Oceanicola sp.]